MKRLVGDVGGTNVRLAWCDEKRQLNNIALLKRCDFANIGDAVDFYLRQTNVTVDEILIAANAPIVDDYPICNHNYWGYREFALAGNPKIMFFNDGVAHAMAIPFLQPQEFHELYAGHKQEGGTIAVLGIGTEVSFAYGLYEQGQYAFQPSEGGHQIAGGVTAEQISLLAKMQAQGYSLQWNHLTSGRGIAFLYEHLFHDKKETPQILEALQQGDPQAEQTMQIFCELLAVLSANAAYTFMPTGGIYLTGGICALPSVVTALQRFAFSTFYQWNKDPNCCIKDIPVYSCDNPLSGLIGLANYRE